MANNGVERYTDALSFHFLTNTIELDFGVSYDRTQFPTKSEIYDFLLDELELTSEMVEGVQFITGVQRVFVQLTTEEFVQEVERKLEKGLVMQVKGIRVFGYRCGEPRISVTITNVDMEVPKNEVQRVMERYGKVVDIRRGRNNDFSSATKFVTDGTWRIRMTPTLGTKPPEVVFYHGHKMDTDKQHWVLNYDGAGNCCILCGSRNHKVFRCGSKIPREGMNGKPAGLNQWTDIVTFKYFVAESQGGDQPDTTGWRRLESARKLEEKLSEMEWGMGLDLNMAAYETRGDDEQQFGKVRLEQSSQEDEFQFQRKSGWRKNAGRKAKGLLAASKRFDMAEENGSPISLEDEGGVLQQVPGPSGVVKRPASVSTGKTSKLARLEHGGKKLNDVSDLSVPVLDLSSQEKQVEEVFDRGADQSKDDYESAGEGKLAGRTCEEGSGEHEARFVDLPSDPESEDEDVSVSKVGEGVKLADEICTGEGGNVAGEGGDSVVPGVEQNGPKVGLSNDGSDSNLAGGGKQVSPSVNSEAEHLKGQFGSQSGKRDENGTKIGENSGKSVPDVGKTDQGDGVQLGKNLRSSTQDKRRVGKGPPEHLKKVIDEKKKKMAEVLKEKKGQK